MRPGTLVRLPDGREGTVTYHGLDGYGIQWGRIEVDQGEILGASCLFGTAPPGWKWAPEAMLREPYPSAEVECVGREYEVVESR